jgi:large subunit ribosomal protein L6
MSKIARLPIIVPQAVSLLILEGGKHVKIFTASDSIMYPFSPLVDMVKEGSDVTFKLKMESRDRTSRSIVGTLHASIKRAISDIQNKFVAKVQLKGVGYKAIFANGILTLSLGFSHAVKILIPKEVELKVVQNTNIEIVGVDRRIVMSLATTIRNLRKPEPYKGKGVFVNDETILIKEGKKK